MKWYKNVAQLRIDLAAIMNDVEYGFEDSTGAGDGEPHESVRPENKYLSEFLAASYMKALSKGKDEGQSAYNTLGQRAEPSFLKDGENCYVLQSIYRPGLVYFNAPVKRRYYLRDSADGVAVVTVISEGSEEEPITSCCPIECKCRASERTYQREILIRSVILLGVVTLLMAFFC